jgi:hypothetical protein
MSPKTHQTITKHFASLSDPRNGNAQLHLLQDILVITICAIICGAEVAPHSIVVTNTTAESSIL